MNNDQRILEIDDIERALLGEDPTLPKRMRALERTDTLNVFVVFSLLATGAVLLAVGLATLSFGVWTTGVAALIMSALVRPRAQAHAPQGTHNLRRADVRPVRSQYALEQLK